MIRKQNEETIDVSENTDLAEKVQNENVIEDKEVKMITHLEISAHLEPVDPGAQFTKYLSKKR